MHISDQHVEALRTYFTDLDEHHRRLTRLQAAGELAAYNTLLTATVLELLERRIRTENRAVDITRWVAATRTRLLRAGDLDSVPDPGAAEALLRTASGLESNYAELDPLVQVETQYLLLNAFRTDLELDDDAFEHVLTAARHHARAVPQQR